MSKNCAKNCEKNCAKFFPNICEKKIEQKIREKSNTSIPLWQVKFYRIRDPRIGRNVFHMNIYTTIYPHRTNNFTSFLSC